MMACLLIAAVVLTDREMLLIDDDLHICQMNEESAMGLCFR